jgi:hypothetical protein
MRVLGPVSIVLVPSVQTLHNETATHDPRGVLKRKSQAELYLAAWCRGLGDSPELRRVYEAIRSAEICVIQRVECFSTYLQLYSLRHRELSLQREIQSLPAWTIDSVASTLPNLNAAGVVNAAVLNHLSAVRVFGPKTGSPV